MRRLVRGDVPLGISAICLLFFVLLLSACSGGSGPADDPRIRAIKQIRPVLGLPESSLEFIENTNMLNSPDGHWTVSAYRDSEGRKYYVENTTLRVVEIDGRGLLQGHAPTQAGEVLDALRARAQSIAGTVLPDFSSQQAKLTYEEGQKGDNYFFTWRDDDSPTALNRPFLQLAFTGSGELFAYYNTLSD